MISDKPFYMELLIRSVASFRSDVKVTAQITHTES